MKVIYSNGKLSVEVEGETQKDVFRQLAAFEEVFSIKKCGACQSEDLKFVARTVDENEYFEYACSACSARLAMGQNKRGGSLFPKRKNEDGTWKKGNGFEKYVKPKE